MALHLTKIAYRIDAVEDLSLILSARREYDEALGQDVVRIKTRNMPRRVDELLPGGSLYWIVKGFVRVRQSLLGIDRVTDPESGKTFCWFVVDPLLVPTVPTQRRGHQGWRYLVDDDAPADMPGGQSGEISGETLAEMPVEMMLELKELGLL